MNRLTFSKVVHGQKLMFELLAAFPTLGNVQGFLEWDESDVWVSVPAGVDSAAVAALVAAHDPTPPAPPVIAPKLRAAFEAVETQIANATTLAQLKSAVANELTFIRALARATLDRAGDPAP